MDDVNKPRNVRNECYNPITKTSWQDVYVAGAVREASATVLPAIDGWEENEVPLGIDYIFSNPPHAIETYEVKFDGTKLPFVSNHYGDAVTYS